MSEQSSLVTEREALSMGFSIYGYSEALIAGLDFAHEAYGHGATNMGVAVVLRTVALKLINKV